MEFLRWFCLVTHSIKVFQYSATFRISKSYVTLYVSQLDSTISPEVIINLGFFSFLTEVVAEVSSDRLCLKTNIISCTDFILKLGCFFFFLHLTLCFFPFQFTSNWQLCLLITMVTAISLLYWFSFSLYTSNIMLVLVTWQTLIKILFSVVHLVVNFLYLLK